MSVIDHSAADIKYNATIMDISRSTAIQTLSLNATILDITLAP